MRKYPGHIRVGGGGAAGTGGAGAGTRPGAAEVTYSRVPGFYSLYLAGSDPEPEADSSGSSHDDAKGPLAVLPDDSGGRYAVYKGTPRRQAASAAGPVYSTGPGGPLAVPTGLVFVRLKDGCRAEQRRDDFRAAGFDVARTLSYAPNAAWLKPREAEAGGALANLGALKKVPDVVHVEPQMLSVRALR